MGTLGILMGVGALTSASAAYQQGIAAQQAANYNAAIMRNNAIMMENQAKDAAYRAEKEKGFKRREVQKNIAKTRVGFAGANIDLGSGTPQMVQEDIVSLGDEDLAMIEYNSQMEQWGFRAQAQDARARADLESLKGRQAARAGRLGAFNSLIGAATQYYSLKLG